LTRHFSKYLQALSDNAHPLQFSEHLDPLLEHIGDARLVLIGEASHGTSEYYSWRARLTKRLIQEKGFSFVAVEGDWPDCYAVNRFAKGYENSGKDAYNVLRNFGRWPTWMWANWEVVAFITWLNVYNKDLPLDERVGFYGLDVYSLWESMAAVVEYLEDVDPEAAEAARQAYMCFEPYGQDVQEYAYSTAMVPQSCEDEVVDLLTKIRGRAAEYPADHEAKLNAEQNALVMRNAERYYRAMVRSNTSSWNVRDRHMVEVLDHLLQFHQPDAKAIVWEHNTHIGDARATSMARRGEVNVGQLVRENYEMPGVVLVGFGSYQGSVIAGKKWGAPIEKMEMPPARQESWEYLLHQSGGNRLYLLPELRELEEEWRGHRAIGVVYHPEHDHLANYVPTNLAQRYDAFIYLDETQALHPLHLAPYDSNKPPDTYPWGV
jgi:erythromycin esterase-like protein